MTPIKAKYTSLYGCVAQEDVTIIGFVCGHNVVRAVIMGEQGQLSEASLSELVVEQPVIQFHRMELRK